MTAAPLDILATALDWAKAEMFSSAFFAAFGIAFLIVGYGFWQMGKTDVAKAFVIPLLIVGGLLVILGVGLMISNLMQISSFPDAYNADAKAFLAAEIARVERTIEGYNNALFKFIPIIIIVCAGLLLVVKSPLWQASMMCIIAMMAIILLVDMNANARLETYKTKLLQAEQSH